MNYKNISKQLIFTLTVVVIASQLWKCGSSVRVESYPTDSIYTNINTQGIDAQITFQRGHNHNHPLMAIWTSDLNNNYIETVFIAQSIGKGVFEHGDKSTGKWLPGAIRRPAALPVWAHSRNVQESDGLYIPTENTAMPDAISGATPQNNFVLKTTLKGEYSEEFYMYFEINQTWDWNEYWTNNKYPNDAEYKTSCQPSLVYRAKVNKNAIAETFSLQLIGHGHYNGSDGSINEDLTTITSAKNITKLIDVTLK